MCGALSCCSVLVSVVLSLPRCVVSCCAVVVFVSVVLVCCVWGSLLLFCVGQCSVVIAALCCELLCCGSVCKCSAGLLRVGLALVVLCWSV